MRGGAVRPRELGEQADSARRIIAIIRDVEPPKRGNVEVHVFVNHDSLTAQTPISDPHYAGTFTFFGAEHAAHRGKPSFLIDITGALASAAQARSGTGSTIKVQLLPVPIRASRRKT